MSDESRWTSAHADNLRERTQARAIGQLTDHNDAIPLFCRNGQIQANPALACDVARRQFENGGGWKMECARRWQSPTESSTVTAWAGVASRLTTDVNSTHWSPPMGSATAAEGGKGVGFEQLIPEQGLRGTGAGCLPGSRDACATVDEDFRDDQVVQQSQAHKWTGLGSHQVAAAGLRSVGQIECLDQHEREGEAAYPRQPLVCTQFHHDLAAQEKYPRPGEPKFGPISLKCEHFETTILVKFNG